MKNKKVDYNQKVLEVKNLRQYFQTGWGKKKLTIKAIDDISFDIYKREVFGLVGESGCGKTTTGRTIIRLYSPTDGTIKFNDRIIGAGHSGNIHRIKKAKKEAKLEQIKADSYKYSRYLILEEYKQLVNSKKIEIYRLKSELDKVIFEIKQPLREFSDKKNELDRSYKLDKSDVLYQKRLEIDRIKGSNFYNTYITSKNQIKELRIIANGHIEQARQSIIDETVLLKEISLIEEKLQKDIKAIRHKNKKTNTRFSYLFDKEIKQKIAELKKQKVLDLKKLNDDYKNNLVKLENTAPDVMVIKEKIEHATKEFAQKIDELSASILVDKENLKKALNELSDRKKENPSEFSVDYNAISNVKAQLKETIKIEKQGIKDAKENNKNKVPKELYLKRNEALKNAKVTFKKEISKLREELKLLEKKSQKYNETKAKCRELKKSFRSELDGIKATLVKETDIMSRMQMIFQDPIASLNPRMVVREIIAEGLRIQGIHDAKVIDEKVFGALKLVGLLPEHASRYPHEFSGGQRQRIGIARALVINPEFIIADEPISALDVSIQAQVINLLNELKEELDLTILFIAHDLSVVKYFSDRIGVMYYGKMVELAPADELFKNPLHPYTKSLLSAIPHPDPIFEKDRKREIYDPIIHDYAVDKPSFREIKEGHFIYANDVEFEKYKKELDKKWCFSLESIEN